MEQELFQGEEWDVIIVDEAQTIRNPSSQVSEAVRRLRGIFKICLSGTPVENSLKDLWSQSDFLNPGLLGSYKEFSERFSDILEGDANDLPAQSNSLKAKQLRATVQPFILRRLKREVAKELPAKTEVVLECELTPEERKHYEALILSSRKEVVEKLAEGASPLSALELLLRLRQACCHTGLLPGISARSSSKVSLLMESLLASSAQGHRAIVFSQWTSLLDRVEPHLRDSQISFQRIDGSTSNRDKIVSEFQEEDGPGVLLLSLKAGGVGLTLTAADHVYILDPWWNPAVEDQASDRAHRIGQDKPVMVYRLVAQDTVEERVIELQNRKRALLAAAVGDTGEVSLSKDELLFLLEG
jgi:SNF2 family DNA or RNA helicase